MASPRQHFLDSFDQEHATTLRLLRAYPEDKLDLRPHAKCKTARELMFVFAAESMLGAMVLNDQFPEGMTGEMAPPPDSKDALLAAVESATADFRALISGKGDGAWGDAVKFFTAPKTISEIPMGSFLWMMLHDQIHHRGQLSIYLRMADGRVPSIYGPSADEPWM